MRMSSCTLNTACCLALIAGLAGCATSPSVPQRPQDVAGTAWATASQVQQRAVQQAARWEHLALPGKRQVEFAAVRHDGREAMSARAVAAASVVRKRVRIEPAELGNLRFSWKVPELIAAADLAQRDADDSPVRVMLAFEGDRSRFSPRDAMLSELSRTLTGEELPYATLMYVWCNRRPPGTIVNSPRTDRIRKLVLESGPNRLNRWLDYERDIRADYERVFGEPPGALLGIAIMTDTDNTRSTAQAWYGPLHHGVARASRRP
jgi:hypothetical protein